MVVFFSRPHQIMIIPGQKKGFIKNPNDINGRHKSSTTMDNSL